MLEDTRHNLEECTKFFNAAWNMENDPFKPLKVSEVYKGIKVPDTRVKSLKDIYPHYFVRILDENDPDFKTHEPGCPEFMMEREEIITTIRAMRAIQERYNEEVYSELMRRFTALS
jgi:hypothetical protein